MNRKTAPLKSDVAVLVQFRRVDDLIPYARNARTHSDAQVAQIAASIAEFGWTNPIPADADGIVAGHGRVLAARQLYEAGRSIALPSGALLEVGTVPVIDCTGWDEHKRRAYVLADNQLALQAGWDSELLRIEIEALDAAGYNLDLIGFDDAALKSIFGIDDADAPEDFGEHDEGIETDHQCPKCGYRWSGSTKPFGAARKGAGELDDESPEPAE